MPLPAVATDYLIDLLVGLLNIPSPTGLAEPAVAYLETALADLGLASRRTPKGGLIAFWPNSPTGAHRILTAHVDTLGAMVKEIKGSGRLKLTRLGGFAWNTVEGEGCRVITAAGHSLRGSLLCVKASSHVHGGEVGSIERSDDTLEVRLDERTDSAETTRGLGVEVGDFVAFDPRVETGPAGFVRSRHLDDKAGAACIVAAVKALVDSGQQPAHPTHFHFSNYEEVGLGASDLPQDLNELVVVDMAAVGAGQNSDEFHVSLCVKDSGGPYHVDLTRRLRGLATAHGIPHRIDIYPNYSSDGTAYWRAGGAAQVALIGPGVDASHNYERTHVDALLATTNLVLAYLLADEA